MKSSYPTRTIGRLLILLVPFLLTGCQLVDQTITPMFMMSTEQEMQLGQKVQAEIDKGITPVQDPVIVNFIRRVGSVVLGNAPQKAAVPTQFFVIKNDEINAFAIPGGNMYVHTGLINAAQDEAELAAVMAHEYGHVVYRHAAKHVSRQTGLSMVEQIIVGSQSQQMAQLLAGVVSQSVMTRYSREDELEADSIAVPTLYRAGYDPNALVTIFQTLQTRYGDQSGGVKAFFSSHPATGERIEKARSYIATLPAKQTVRPITDLRTIQARLQELGMGRK